MGLIEIAPNRFVADKRRTGVVRSHLPLPYVVSDEMPAAEHVDGRFYTSKAAFRAVTRAHGLTEVGTEKLKPKGRGSASPDSKRKRREALKIAKEKYRAGYQARSR
jgi:hypothetical protein